jgi:hypothetical protein
MVDAFLADAVLVIHLLFIAFVVGGALLLRRWPALVVLHLPAALWGAYAALAGRVCPLTPLENRLRAASGQAGYEGGFVGHYLLPIIYPGAMTREVQVAIGGFVLLLNLGLYAAVAWRHRRARRGRAQHDSRP